MTNLDQIDLKIAQLVAVRCKLPAKTDTTICWALDDEIDDLRHERVILFQAEIESKNESLDT